MDVYFVKSGSGWDMHCQYCIDYFFQCGGDANDVDGPYQDGGGESDLIHHCDLGDKCARAMQTKNGFVGVCFHNALTIAGVHYTSEALEAYIEERGGVPEVLDMWAKELRDYTLCKSHEDILCAYNKTRYGEIRHKQQAPRKKQDTKVNSMMAFFDDRPAVSEAIRDIDIPF